CDDASRVHSRPVLHSRKRPRLQLSVAQVLRRHRLRLDGNRATPDLVESLWRGGENPTGGSCPVTSVTSLALAGNFLASAGGKLLHLIAYLPAFFSSLV